MLIIKIILLFLFGCFWRMGGSHKFNKLFRRVGCPVILLVKSLFCFTWIGLLSLPLLFLTLSQGYGVSSILNKILLNNYVVRFSCGLLYSLATVFLLRGNLLLIVLNTIFVSTLVMLLGTGYFKLNDVKEEFFVGVVVGLIPMLS